MTTLPTCWYCPECEFYDIEFVPAHVTESGRICGGTQVAVPVFPPGTPLPVILDALGHTYHAVTGSAPTFGVQVHDDPEDADNYSWIGGPILVVVEKGA